jgi:hypothetical protein
MRLYLLLAIFILSSFSLLAQCPDYQSELQNMESNISTAIRNLKKAEKAETLEVAQQLIDKSTNLAEISLKSATLAKEYAVACDCNEGINSATLIYHITFDFSTQTHEVAGCSLLNEIKTLVKKAITAAENVKNAISEGESDCMEIPEIDQPDGGNSDN